MLPYYFLVNEALLTKQGVRLGGARVGSPTSPASGVYKQIAINLQLVCTPKKTDPFLSSFAALSQELFPEPTLQEEDNSPLEPCYKCKALETNVVNDVMVDHAPLPFQTLLQ